MVRLILLIGDHIICYYLDLFCGVGGNNSLIFGLFFFRDNYM